MIFSVLSYSVIVLFVFFLMEGVAWFLHKYVMHGLGWFLHEDHHRYTKHRLQKNDIFGLFFSLISFFFILTGILSGFDLKFAVGIGITLYGIGYFLVHVAVRRPTHWPEDPVLGASSPRECSDSWSAMS